MIALLAGVWINTEILFPGRNNAITILIPRPGSRHIAFPDPIRSPAHRMCGLIQSLKLPTTKTSSAWGATINPAFIGRCAFTNFCGHSSSPFCLWLNDGVALSQVQLPEMYPLRYPAMPTRNSALREADPNNRCINGAYTNTNCSTAKTPIANHATRLATNRSRDRLDSRK